jgi:hypothetical protein
MEEQWKNIEVPVASLCGMYKPDGCDPEQSFSVKIRPQSGLKMSWVETVDIDHDCMDHTFRTARITMKYNARLRRYDDYTFIGATPSSMVVETTNFNITESILKSCTCAYRTDCNVVVISPSDCRPGECPIFPDLSKNKYHVLGLDPSGSVMFSDQYNSFKQMRRWLDRDAIKKLDYDLYRTSEGCMD